MTYKIFHRFLSRNSHINRASTPNYRGGLFPPPAELDFSSSDSFILGVFYGYDFYVCRLLISKFCCLISVFCIFFDRRQRLHRFSAQKGRINQTEQKYFKRTQFSKYQNACKLRK
jgi:hypothetical protein